MKYNLKIGDKIYLMELKSKLTRFLDKVNPDIVIYNAGSDPYCFVPCGCMNVSKEQEV